MQDVNDNCGLEYLSAQFIYYFACLQNDCRILTLWQFAVIHQAFLKLWEGNVCYNSPPHLWLENPLVRWGWPPSVGHAHSAPLPPTWLTLLVLCVFCMWPWWLSWWILDYFQNHSAGSEICCLHCSVTHCSQYWCVAHTGCSCVFSSGQIIII